MNIWKFYSVTHARHLICNPFSERKIDEVISLLGLPDHARLLDIACGKGEFLRRSALRWNCIGVGVDISPFFIADARENLRSDNLTDRVELIEANAQEYTPPAMPFDASVCLGATWIWNGFEGTLRALSTFTRPGGLVVVGEPFWKRPPSAGYLEATKIPFETYGTHIENVETGTKVGLSFLHAIVSSHDDWDRYEGYQWYAAEEYAQKHSDDHDASEILMRVRESRDHYLRWGRDEMGWAVYLFRNRGAA
jgi:SAM-dependent methyltransferase